MKKLQSLFFMFCMFALVVSFSMADDQPAIMRDGIKVTVQYDPQGTNNWIVACVTFINENQYRVEVTGRAVITCESGDKREDAINPFSTNKGETHWVNIGRFGACGNGRIKNIDVETDVKKVNP
ncbi:MAG: hypothetical protein M0Z67_08130 [Nitrospiraceae bacterium]|nr:hypothetical protein [Nitrospiraceae bacterium]